MREKPALKPWALAALAAGLAACASIPPPHSQLAAARAMVSQAQAVAPNEAPAELGAAQAKLSRAEQAMQRDDYVNARIYAEQAEVDAKYAWTLAESARTQRAAAEVGKSIDALRYELQRRSQ
jgi:hypothetical protein